jgi:hypothetical protein
MGLTTKAKSAETPSDPHEIGRITIHSPMLSNNAYLLDLLNGSIWLSERTGTGSLHHRSIEIQLHPVRSPWFRWVRALTDPPTIPPKIRRFVSKLLRPFTTERSSSIECHGPTIIERLRIQSSSVRVQLDKTSTIDIRRFHMRYGESLLPTIKACLRAWRCWRECRWDGRLNVQAFLLLRYRGVQVGDLVGSETIGLNSCAGGSLRRCGFVAIFSCLIDAVYTVDYILGKTWHAHEWEYVTTSETTYLEELYRRILKLHRFRTLELYDYSGQLRAIGPDENVPNPFIVRAWEREDLSAEQKDRTSRYLAERVSDAGQKLWYMNVGRNAGGQERVIDEQGHVVARDDQSLTAVIFLHGFDDAQYMFGLDGFEDLYDWTVVTIDECLGNGHIGRVLIKGHPNIDLAEISADKYGVENLRHRYKQDTRVMFINPRTDIKALKSLGLVYGITHHGSVAEELVAVGVPVIASSAAPWRKNYPFLRLWDSPIEYAEILRSLAPTDWRAPNSKEIEALIQYVYEYRINLLPRQDIPVSVQWMLWKDSTLDILTPDISSITEQHIAKLEAKSPELIEWLHDRERMYRKYQEKAEVRPDNHRTIQRLANG